MTTPREHADDKTEQTVTDALRRAFSLGKTYWQQAHSDFISQHVKADATRAKFQELCERTEDTIDTLRAQLAEAQDALQAAQRLFKEALPKFNWGASFLDANAIQLLNEVPAKVDAAIAPYLQTLAVTTPPRKSNES